MAKPFNKCKLCNAPKFVNFAGLCKRCNSKKEGVAIAEKAVKAQQEHYAEDDAARVIADAKAAEDAEVAKAAESTSESAPEAKEESK